MARDRDWVDYANLAANAVQTAQLDGLNTKMRQLAELELQKEYREQQEAAVAKCEDLLRDAVFVYTEQLRDVEEVASQNPVAAYIRASHVKRLYANIPQFTASGFRKFEDKERLANVQRACDRLIRESAGRLKPGELEDCNLCIAHVFDRKELVKLIEVQEERETLEQTKATAAKKVAPLRDALNENARERNWLEQEASKHSVRHKVYLAMVALGVGTISVLVVLGLLFCIVDSGGLDRFMTSDSMGSVNAIGFIALIIAGIGGVAHWLASEEYKDKKEALEKQKADIACKLALANREVDRIQSNVDQSKPLYARFGEATSGDYRKMLQGRDTLLTQMLGDFAKGFTERRQSPVSTSSHVVTADQKINDVVLALLALGFKQIEADKAARAVQAMLGPDASVENLVRACLSKKILKCAANQASPAERRS